MGRGALGWLRMRPRRSRIAGPVRWVDEHTLREYDGHPGSWRCAHGVQLDHECSRCGAPEGTLPPHLRRMETK